MLQHVQKMQQKSDKNFVVENNADIQYLPERKRLKIC